MNLKHFALLGLGMLTGLADAAPRPHALPHATTAATEASAILPLSELRQLTEVYGLIRSEYVEPVEADKLLSQAISGMVSSLDPHSVYLDKKSYAK